MRLRQAHKIARSPRTLAWMAQYAAAVEAGVTPPEPIWNHRTGIRVLRRLFRWSTLNRRRNDAS